VVKTVIHGLNVEASRPKKWLRPRGILKSCFGIAQQKVTLQLENPMKAGNHCDAAPKHASFERRFIDAVGAPRLPAKTLDEILDA
jgi:hypothetical protein